MSAKSCEFLITDAGAPGFARRKAYGLTDFVEVLDRTTQAMLKMLARDVSPFRHTLVVDGKPCRILNILK